jgi:tRNA pseudouridine55 synthase
MSFPFAKTPASFPPSSVSLACRLVMALTASIVLVRSSSKSGFSATFGPENTPNVVSAFNLAVRRRTMERIQTMDFLRKTRPSFLSAFPGKGAKSHRLFCSGGLESKQQSQQYQTNSTSLNQPLINSTSAIDEIPLYLAEGLLAVHKPLNWTSQDVVSYIRVILERDARNRGAKPTPIHSRRNKSQKVKVGHGGTLDPLASGVLVVGVGRGTKQLNDYLSGSKAYRATGRLGMETSTLDMDPTGDVVKEASWEHVNEKMLKAVLPKFRGTINQVPPLFSAKRVNGKKLYELARDGTLDVDIVIESKQVEIYNLELVDVELPEFTIDMECGGGTFVRSLIRDIASELESVATTTFLQRTKQGPFVLEDCLEKDNWSAEKIYDQIEEWNKRLQKGNSKEV